MTVYCTSKSCLYLVLIVLHVPAVLLILPGSVNRQYSSRGVYNGYCTYKYKYNSKGSNKLFLIPQQRGLLLIMYSVTTIPEFNYKNRIMLKIVSLEELISY